MRSQSVISEILPLEERAIENVVARYQRVAPAVTRFARSLAGDDRLQLRLGSEPAAGEGEIVVDPRVFQAAYALNAPVTPDEVAIASALHEVVHLVSTRLDEPRPLPPSWPKPDDAVSDDEPVDLLTALERTGGPAAEILFFALEDARQERLGLGAYPGVRSVLADIYDASLRPVMASTGPLGQFALGCFLLTGGYHRRRQLERIVDGRVALALADGADYLKDAATTTDPWTVATAALRLLEIARLHGLVVEVPASESAAQQRARQRHDADSLADGVDRVRLVSPVVQDISGYESTRKAAEARSGESPRKAPSEVAGQESTDQILRVSQAPRVYLPNGQGGKLLVMAMPELFRQFRTEGRAALSRAARAWKVGQRQVSGELYHLFAANQRRGLRSGYDAGDLSPHAALFLGAGLYQRMYERRALPTRRSYAVSLLVDASASMLQQRPVGPHARSSWGLSAATLGAWTLARLCDELQVDFEVALFNRSFAARPDDTEWSYTRSRSQATAGLRQTQDAATARRLTATLNHYLIKPFDRRWRDAEDLMAGLFWAAAEPGKAAQQARREPRSTAPVSMFEKAANVDEFNLIHAAERMARLGPQVRVLVVLADGMTRGSVDALAQAVRSVEGSGTTVLGIGIGDATVEAAYSRCRVVDHPDALARAMVEGTREALRRSLALQGLDGWWLRASRTARDPWKEPVHA